MANIKSAKTRIRRNARRTEINQTRRSRVRTFIKRIEAAIEAKDKKTAEESFQTLQPEFQRAVAKGIFHKNTVARKMSRLSAGIKAIGGANLTAVKAASEKKAPAKTKAKAVSKKAPTKKTATKKA